MSQQVHLEKWYFQVMRIHRQWVVWACLTMLPACRTPMLSHDAGAPADSSDAPNHVAPANLCGDVAQVAVGMLHACALKADGTLWCWGANGYGQLGDTTLADKAAPVPVTALGSDVVQVTVGYSYSCALKRDATIWCWARMAAASSATARPPTLRRRPRQSPSGQLSRKWPQAAIWPARASWTAHSGAGDLAILATGQGGMATARRPR